MIDFESRSSRRYPTIHEAPLAFRLCPHPFAAKTIYFCIISYPYLAYFKNICLQFICEYPSILYTIPYNTHGESNAKLQARASHTSHTAHAN